MVLLRFNFYYFIKQLTNKIIAHLYYLLNTTPPHLFLSNSKRMTNTFNDFVDVIKKDPKVQVKINDVLDRYNKRPYNYQSKIGYDTLAQNVIL